MTKPTVYALVNVVTDNYEEESEQTLGIYLSEESANKACVALNAIARRSVGPLYDVRNGIGYGLTALNVALVKEGQEINSAFSSAFLGGTFKVVPFVCEA